MLITSTVEDKTINDNLSNNVESLTKQNTPNEFSVVNRRVIKKEIKSTLGNHRLNKILENNSFLQQNKCS